MRLFLIFFHVFDDAAQTNPFDKRKSICNCIGILYKIKKMEKEEEKAILSTARRKERFIDIKITSNLTENEFI